MQHPLSARFERYVKECTDHAGPLYARLASFVAREPELLDLAVRAPREPVPNLFFASVHYLLLRGESHLLADYYPSLRENPRTDEDLWPAFLDFCVRHHEQLERLIETRLVQVNEVARCSFLMPAFSLVHELGGKRPLVLVDVGTSAGLNLNWDRYGYTYGDRRFGRDSTVQLTCELRGVKLPPLPDAFPEVASRVGIDLNPIDLRDADERLWLHALIWPDHPERVARLEAAIGIALEHPPEPRAVRRGPRRYETAH